MKRGGKDIPKGPSTVTVLLPFSRYVVKSFSTHLSPTLTSTPGGRLIGVLPSLERLPAVALNALAPSVLIALRETLSAAVRAPGRKADIACALGDRHFGGRPFGMKSSEREALGVVFNYRALAASFRYSLSRRPLEILTRLRKATSSNSGRSSSNWLSHVSRGGSPVAVLAMCPTLPLPHRERQNGTPEYCRPRTREHRLPGTRYFLLSHKPDRHPCFRESEGRARGLFYGGKYYQ